MSDSRSDAPGEGGEGTSGTARSLLEDLVDYGIYAPLGAAIRVVGELPGLVEKGRARAGNRIGTARVVGRFAVTEVRRRVARAFSAPPAPQADHDDPGPAARGPAAARPGRAASTGVARTRATEPVSEPAAAGSPRDAAGVAPDAASGPDDLPIPNYDSLAASQVVPRLASLSPTELESVRSYESAHRRRRTVLSRVGQLQGVAAARRGGSATRRGGP